MRRFALYTALTIATVATGLSFIAVAKNGMVHAQAPTPVVPTPPLPPEPPKAAMVVAPTYHVPVGELLVISTAGSTAEHITWTYVPEPARGRAVECNTSFAFSSPTAGDYPIVVSGSMPDSIDAKRIIITVGGEPPPPDPLDALRTLFAGAVGKADALTYAEFLGSLADSLDADSGITTLDQCTAALSAMGPKAKARVVGTYSGIGKLIASAVEGVEDKAGFVEGLRALAAKLREAVQ